MRYLDKRGTIGWKASPRFLATLADAEPFSDGCSRIRECGPVRTSSTHGL
jgi:hypothetical protein